MNDEFIGFNGLDIRYQRVLGVTNYEADLNIQKFKMADPIWRTTNEKLLDWDKIWYPGVSGVANYES